MFHNMALGRTISQIICLTGMLGKTETTKVFSSTSRKALGSLSGVIPIVSRNWTTTSWWFSGSCAWHSTSRPSFCSSRASAMVWIAACWTKARIPEIGYSLRSGFVKAPSPIPTIFVIPRVCSGLRPAICSKRQQHVLLSSHSLRYLLNTSWSSSRVAKFLVMLVYMVYTGRARAPSTLFGLTIVMPSKLWYPMPSRGIWLSYLSNGYQGES